MGRLYDDLASWILIVWDTYTHLKNFWYHDALIRHKSDVSYRSFCHGLDSSTSGPDTMLSAFQARPIVELKQRDKSKIESLLAYGTEADGTPSLRKV